MPLVSWHSFLAVPKKPCFNSEYLLWSHIIVAIVARSTGWGSVRRAGIFVIISAAVSRTASTLVLLVPAFVFRAAISCTHNKLGYMLDHKKKHTSHTHTQ